MPEYESQLGSTTAIFTALGGDVLNTFFVGIGIVLGIAVLVGGVMWGWRKFKSTTGIRK